MISKERWIPADDMVLEPNALEAVREANKSLALTAGPGAGKTEMLAQKADFLLKTDSSPYPKRILAVSFKVDASKNLKDRVTRRCGSILASRFDSFTFHAFAKRIIDKFRPLLTGIDTLDPDYVISSERTERKSITFNDLVPLAIDLISKNPMVKNTICQTYSDVFLDEFQDCTAAQYNLLKSAFLDTGIRLTAVGDVKQRIMRWAGAMDDIFPAFISDFTAKPLTLYQNFRATPVIRRMQNRLVQQMDITASMDEAEIVGNEGTIEIRRYDNQEDEAKDVALQIRNWVEYDAVFLNEIAILISKQPNLYSESLKRELKSYGIPYRNEQEVQDLFCEPIINIILDYILIIYGSREPEAWQRFHSFVIQDDFSERSEIEYQRWQSFIRKQQNLVNRNDDIARIWERIKDMLKEFGIDHIRSLSSDYENIHRLRELLKNLKTQISRSLRENPDLVSAIKSYWEDNSLRILTIHKSKGLEFSKVVILGVEKETFWGNPNDERNAYFVGVSRVKEHLILTYCDHRDVPVSADSQQVRNWRRIRNPQQEFLCYV
jgi:superfamily I DNA/RNA helicase